MNRTVHGIPWVVVLAVTRLLTHASICGNPLSPAQVRGIVVHWLSFAHVRTIASNDRGFDRFAGIKRINPLA